ncbi:MAG: AraC family transcriptional regulator [Bryobacterales bacterium]|nr:AraC family transcriptional regulator [Bryobacterales bacterium]
MQERFTKYLAEPPMTYLTLWRLQLAARSLEKTSRGVADIAAAVGYESEAAFNRAFKRQFGQPPGRYRSEHRSPSTKNAESDRASAGHLDRKAIRRGAFRSVEDLKASIDVFLTAWNNDPKPFDPGSDRGIHC